VVSAVSPKAPKNKKKKTRLRTLSKVKESSLTGCARTSSEATKAATGTEACNCKTKNLD